MNQENGFPFVSIIIPCRNEEKHIKRCLESVLEQSYPVDRMEVLVVDGQSEDDTRRILDECEKRYSRVKIINNPAKIAPAAFNLGIKSSRGKVIVLMGAHSIYDGQYVEKCVAALLKYSADNVGGKLLVYPTENTAVARAITLAMSHPFGTGNSYYKIGLNERKWVDTVFGGCYRKDVFGRIGYFNEKLLRGQDIDFNSRLKRAGGKILYVPDIIVRYFIRSNLKDFFIHDFWGGVWVVYLVKFTGKPLRPRHYTPVVFLAIGLFLAIGAFFYRNLLWLLFGATALYALLSLYSSSTIAVKEKKWKLFFLMPIAFASRHAAYALGSVVGLAKLAVSKNN